MLRPKQTKFQKAYKGSIRGNDPSGTRLKFGTIGLKALEPDGSFPRILPL